jgi:signal transduction histidine kinase
MRGLAMHSKTEEKEIFPLFIASTVHDIKNALSGVLGELERFTERMDNDNDEDRHMAAVLQYEAARINVSLMQLLTLYKMDHENLGITVMPTDVFELAEDTIAGFQNIARLRQLSILNQIPEELVWNCDSSLIEICLTNIIGNSVRYCDQKVSVDAQTVEHDGHLYLCLTIEDDGRGYPQAMIENSAQYIRRISSRSGSTGLGLYFADTVARLHQNNQHQGFIRLSNEASLGGGRFEIWLP